MAIINIIESTNSDSDSSLPGGLLSTIDMFKLSLSLAKRSNVIYVIYDAILEDDVQIKLNMTYLVVKAHWLGTCILLQVLCS